MLTAMEMIHVHTFIINCVYIAVLITLKITLRAYEHNLCICLDTLPSQSAMEQL